MRKKKTFNENLDKVAKMMSDENEKYDSVLSDVHE